MIASILIILQPVALSYILIQLGIDQPLLSYLKFLKNSIT